MKQDQLWKIYTDRNPQFLTEEQVTMSSAGLKRLFDQTYEKAHEQGVKDGRAQEQMANHGGKGDIFDQMFGGKKP